MVGTCLFLHECSSLEAAKFSSVVPCAILSCWRLLVLNNFLPFPLSMKLILIRGGENPSDENPFLVGLETSIERRGTANIMLHIPQSIDLFVVYSLECILTSSEAIVGKRLFVWLIFSCLWSTRHVFLIIKHKSTHFYFPSHQWITIWRYLAHKEEWKVPVVLKFHKSWPWRFGICFSADHWVW